MERFKTQATNEQEDFGKSLGTCGKGSSRKSCGCPAGLLNGLGCFRILIALISFFILPTCHSIFCFPLLPPPLLSSTKFLHLSFPVGRPVNSLKDFYIV